MLRTVYNPISSFADLKPNEAENVKKNLKEEFTECVNKIENFNIFTEFKRFSPFQSSETMADDCIRSFLIKTRIYNMNLVKQMIIFRRRAIKLRGKF